MARLIDAERLLRDQASIAENCAKSNAQKALMGRVIFNTDNQPAVEAVPVEWLRDKMLRPHMTCANPYEFVLAEWLEEEEVR